MITVPVKNETPDAVPYAALRRTSVRYWVCLGVLVVSAVAVRALPRLLGAYLQKEAVPLKRPLAQFDAHRLEPRYERHPATDGLQPMSDDMIESLGTREYLRLYLADKQKSLTDPTRVANLFVTYYTGRPDMVPHTPDQCYQAGGYDAVDAFDGAVPVPGVGAPRGQVPVRVVRFQAPSHRSLSGGGAPEVAVLYFFHANGDYTRTRDGVRVRLSNPFQRYAYYAKIEVSFTDNQIAAHAGPEAAQAALGPLLEAVMPVLIEDHFDLSKFASAEPAGTGPGR